VEVLVCDKKSRYASEKEALAHIEIIKKKSTREKIPVRAYMCQHGHWHITSKINSEKLLETNNELGKQIEEFKKEITLLKELNTAALKKNNKEENIQVKVDKRIQELNKRNTELKKTIRRVREDNHELITQNLKLKQQL
jgi:Sec-independent protein translocase protein TatA